MAGVVKSVTGLVKAAAGMDNAAPGDQDATKTEAFYTSLATYPFLNLAATAPARLPVLYDANAALRSPHDNAPASPESRGDEARRMRIRRALEGAEVSNSLGGLNDYPEGRALTTLEKYHTMRVVPDTKHNFLHNLRAHLTEVLHEHEPQPTRTREDLEWDRLERIACGAAVLENPDPELRTQLKTTTPTPTTQDTTTPGTTAASATTPGGTLGTGTGTRGVSGDTTPVVGQDALPLGQSSEKTLSDYTTEWYVWGCRQLLTVLNNYLGPQAPLIPADKVVDTVLLYTTDPTASSAHDFDHLRIDPVRPNPVVRLEEALRPNVQHIAREQMKSVTLTRSNTLLETMNALLGLVRWWLNGVARFFFLLSVGLRVLGNGLSALGGLVAFTVVFSIAISVLSALTFMSSSAAEATGTFLQYMARFTDLAKRRSHAGAAGYIKDKLGPRSLGPVTPDEMEEFIGRQLVLRRPTPGVSTRPDVPRLAHSKLLVKCYDLGLVDNTGALLPHVSVEDIMEHFDPDGFFGYAPQRTRRAGALLLLRQLALRHVRTIMSPPTFSGDTEKALRYVFLGGQQDAGIFSLYRALTGLPKDYSKADKAGLYGQMRSVLGHPYSYMQLSSLQSDPARKVATTQAPAWIQHPSHGIISCLVFVVSVDTAITDVGLPSAGASGTQLLQGNHTTMGSATATTTADTTTTKATQPVDLVWQTLALRRPVLVAINKASKLSQRLLADPSAAEKAKAYWNTALREEAHRRGLESELMTVQLTELVDSPPVGAVGLPQLQDWLGQVLADAPTLRCL